MQNSMAGFSPGLRLRGQKFRKMAARRHMRARWWDYACAATYFITIRVHFDPIGERNVFGKVEDGTMILNDVGRIVEEEWEKSFSIRQDMNLTMDEYQVMPDHFHGIFSIGRNPFNWPDIAATSNRSMRTSRPLQSPLNSFGPQVKNVSAMINQFKGAVTRRAKSMGKPIEWQERFHDFIISNQDVLEKCREYVRLNPKRWRAKYGE